MALLTAQVEPWHPTLAEIKPLLPLHWEELALNRDKVPLDPQWEVYDARDRAGELLLVTLRETGRVVGYFWGFIAPGLHYRTCLTLIMDIFYVVPEARGRHGGKRLFRAVSAEARRRGVQRFVTGSKLHMDASRLFVALGFEPIETYYSIWLGG